MFWKGKDTFTIAHEVMTEKAVLDTFSELHQMVEIAMLKCVEPRNVRASSMLAFRGEEPGKLPETQQTLTERERICLEEYAILFTKYSQKAFNHFNKGYERMAREAMTKMRQAESVQANLDARSV
ncbi:WD domain G-beta repeat protein [Perkinsela sp. CCAP 1560/4]|nr:WD domain G-beta repeat protein [Perkinsela sp. CCAP 1560/4]|eukprot:KNH09718.1 WD domain G-beta repeat protein [Perkinsela sp. CCAP 1560/4]